MEENAQQEGNIPMENPAQVEENTHHKKPACTENSASAAPAAAAGPHEGGSAPSPRAPLETTRAPKAAPPFDPSQPPMLPMAMMGKGMLIGKAKGAPLGIGGKGALPPVASVPARSFDDEMPMGKGGSPCREPMHDGREARSRSRNRDERRVEIPISKSSPRSINDKGSSAFMPMQRMGQNTLALRPVGKRPPMIPMQRIVPTSNMMPNSKGKGGSFDPRRPPLMQSNLTSMMPRPPGMGMGMPGARTMPSRPAAPRPMMGGGKMGGKGAGMMQGAKGNAMFNNGMGQPQNPLGMVTPRSMPIGTSGVHAYNVAVSKAKPAVAAKLTKEEGLEHRRQRATPTGPILPLPGTVIARLPPMTRDRLLADDIEEAARTFCISLQLSVPDAVRQVSPMVFYLDFPSVDTAKLFKEKASDQLTVNNYTLTLTFTASRDNLEVTNSLMVRNLQNLTEADVLKAFRALGCPPKSCRIMMDKEPPYKSKGFGFLAYSEPSEAAQALNRLRSVHWKICNNVQISASFARNRFVPSDAKRKNDDSFGKEHLEEQLRMHKNKDPDEEIGEKAKQALAGVNGSMWSNYLDLFKKRKRVTGNWQEVEEYLFSAFEDDETDGMFYDIKSRFFFKGESFYNYFAEEKVCVEIDADGNQKEVPDMVECHKLPPGYVAPGEDPPEPEPVPEPVAEAQPNTNPPDAEPDAKRQRYDPMSQVQPPNVLDAPPEMPRPPPLPECLASMFPNPSDTPPTLPGNVPILPLPPLPPFGSLPGLAMPLPPLPPPGMLLPPPGTLPPPNSGTLPPPSSSTLPPPNSGTLPPPTFGTLPPPNFGTLPPPNFGTLPPPNSLPPASGKESLGAPTAPPNVEAAPERPLPVDAQAPPPPHRDSGPVRPSLPSQPVAEPSQAPPAPSNPPPAAAQPSPVCDLCQRKFMNEEALQRHVLLSELHKTNLIKQQQQQAGRH